MTNFISFYPVPIYLCGFSSGRHIIACDTEICVYCCPLTSQDGDVTPEEENFKWPSVSCDCIPGWSKSGPGLGCNNDIDECLIFSANGEQVCGNFGVCHNMPGSYRCECNDGFQGDRCDEDVDECLSSPCKHGGYCINSLGRYKCHCRHGYSGLDCENACPSRLGYSYVVGQFFIKHSERV